MDKQALMLYSVLGGSGNDSLLPLLLFNKTNPESEGGSSSGGVSDEVLEVMVYKPLGQRALERFAAKISKMSKAQRDKLLASLAMDMIAKEEKGKLGEVLLLAAHSNVLDMLGEPSTVITATGNSSNNSGGRIGAETLGAANKSVKEKVKEIEVGEEEKKEKEEKKTKKSYPPVY